MATQLDPGRPIRWGILGAGGIAATVSRFIRNSPDSDLVAVGSRDAGRAAGFAAVNAVPRHYGSYADLLADDDLDIIYIATTHGQHHEHALMALDAGKPLLVEKAFTLNAMQAREVVQLARAADLFCMEAMWMRLNPLVQRAVEIAHSGRIGKVTTVRADLSRHFPYDPAHRLFDLAAGGGALLDLGVYPMHFAWTVLGKPETVSAVGRLSPTGSDLVAAVQLSYPSGAVAQVHTSAAGPSPDSGLILGTRGWVRLNERVHHPHSLSVQIGDRMETIPTTPWANSYAPQIEEVERCLRAGLTESPHVPLDDTIAILEVIDEVRRQLGVRYDADPW